MVSVGEGDGTVEVCATLNVAGTISTDFIVILAAVEDTGFHNFFLL